VRQRQVIENKRKREQLVAREEGSVSLCSHHCAVEEMARHKGSSALGHCRYVPFPASWDLGEAELCHFPPSSELGLLALTNLISLRFP
jgi:hypothetical protein